VFFRVYDPFDFAGQDRRPVQGGGNGTTAFEGSGYRTIALHRAVVRDREPKQYKT
ncbi:hypothetical protein KI387_020802, partial [Taxus chinensis]